MSKSCQNRYFETFSQYFEIVGILRCSVSAFGY